jgi:energy-coupling factor transport system substrate-specific component
VFGPVAGLLIGLIGHALVDFSWGGLWWSWILVSAVCGCAGGFILNSDDINEGKFGDTASIIRFVVGSLIVYLIGWGLVAPLLDILIYAEPAGKVFAQGWIAGIANTVVVAVLGTLLLVAYSKTRTKTGSLKQG